MNIFIPDLAANHKHWHLQTIAIYQKYDYTQLYGSHTHSN